MITINAICLHFSYSSGDLSGEIGHSSFEYAQVELSGDLSFMQRNLH